MDETSTPITIEAQKLPSGFSHEVGMHRIQRVPPTERRGRVHTSTVSVVMIDLTSASQDHGISANDIAKRWYSGTGAGGQHRNKTQNCLELTHIPTGLVVSASGRSRKNNEREAMIGLERLVQQQQQSAQQALATIDRRSQGGTGSRSGERVRTWKFQNGQVTDHRTGKSLPIALIVKGSIDRMWPTCRSYSKG